MQGHRKPSQKTIAKWQEIIARYTSSGLSVDKFAVREGVSSASVSFWKIWFLGRSPKSRYGASAPGEPVAELASGNFLPLVLEPSSSACPKPPKEGLRLGNRQIEIRCPNGVEVRVVALANDTTAIQDALRAAQEVMK